MLASVSRPKKSWVALLGRRRGVGRQAVAPYRYRPEARRDVRQRHREAGTDADLARDANRAAEHLHEALHDVQPEADAAPARPRHLAEHLEDVAHGLGRDAAAAVGDRDLDAAAGGRLRREGDVALLGELERVVDQV